MTVAPIHNIFRELQEGVKGLLAADELMAIKPAPRIILESEGDFITQITKQLDGPGLSVLVMTPRVRATEAAADGIQVGVAIGITEKCVINRGPTGTQRSADDISAHIIAVLWQKRINDIWDALAFAERTTESLDEGVVAYTITFTTATRVAVINE